MIVIGTDFALTEAEQFTLDHPVIGYHTLATASNVVATTEDPLYPAANLANPATNLRWRGVHDDPPGTDYLTVIVDEVDPIDYVAVAGHNFGSAQIPVSLEGYSTVDGSGNPEWEELVAERLLADDAPLLMRFTRQSLIGVRVKLQAGAEPPEAAVLYVGRLLTLQRKLYVGHAPMPYARETREATGRSEGGQFVGRIVIAEWSAGGIEMKNLTPEWVRSYLVPFLTAAKEAPFFFAWRPATYPNEVAYAWAMSDARPTNDLPNGMMQFNLALQGVVS